MQPKGLAELRRCGFTTIQLRRLFYDSQFHESPNRFEVLAEALDAARRRWGQFDFVLAAGDVEPNRGFEDHLGVVGPSRYRKVGVSPGSCW